MLQVHRTCNLRTRCLNLSHKDDCSIFQETCSMEYQFVFAIVLEVVKLENSYISKLICECYLWLIA